MTPSQKPSRRSTVRKTARPIFRLGLILIIIVFLGMGVVYGLHQSTSSSGKVLPPAKLERLPEKVELDYSWIGLAPYSVAEKYTLVLQPDHSAYTATGQQIHVPMDSTKPKQITQNHATVPVSLINNLLNQVKLHTRNLPESHKPMEVIEHTDDYPNESVAFYDGATVLFTLKSTSNTADGSPWNIYAGESLYNVNGPDIGNQVNTLLKSVRVQKVSSSSTAAAVKAL